VNGGHGIDVTMPSGNLYFYNNTLRSGTQNGPNGHAYTAFIRSSGSASIYFDNNLVFSRNGAVTTNRCLNVNSFASLRNNNLFDCASALYHDGSSAVNDITVINALANASDNLSFDMVDGSNSYFVNETSDWNLQAGGSGAFTTVKTGGLNLGSTYSSDVQANSRTASSATGWSMGAYEKDN
jgi:hypothetical protein